MRTLLVSALVLLAACGRSDAGDRPSAHGAPSATPARGPDPVVLRVPRAGGIARAYVYPALDSTVWRSANATPAIARVLGFDPDGGLLAIQDAQGRAGRVDLRVGAFSTAAKGALTALASADGATIYGLDKAGKVVRLTPTGGSWPFEPPKGIRDVVPLADGSLVIVAARGDSTLAWRVRPPDTRLLDTLAFPRSSRAFGTQLGDRVYLVTEDALHALRARDFSALPPLALGGAIRDVAVTPSGDRLYVALAEDPELRIVDRYRDEVAGVVGLPGPARELRMDALGRYLLARAERGDSVYVVALGTGRVIGAVSTRWREDLPFVAPDGLLALARGEDVVFVDAETLAERRRVVGGGGDFWHLVLWNGFRPRARGLDEPVVFASADSTDPLAVDSAGIGGAFAGTDSSLLAGPSGTPATPAAPPQPAADTAPRPAATTGFTLSFAALRDEAQARALAADIVVEGERARVVPSSVAGTAVFRVVMGPFRSREDAERRGRAARRDFWVYAGAP